MMDKADSGAINWVEDKEDKEDKDDDKIQLSWIVHLRT